MLPACGAGVPRITRCCGAPVPVAVFRLIGHPVGPYCGHVTELPIDDAAALASASHDATVTAAIEALEDAADIASAEEALAEWDADDRRTYQLADLDAEIRGH